MKAINSTSLKEKKLSHGLSIEGGLMVKYSQPPNYTWWDYAYRTLKYLIVVGA